MSYQIKTLELPSRLKLPYVEHGDPSGVPVILLHGVIDSWHSFERVLPHLPKSLYAIALTQRGHGDAERPETGYRTRDFATDVAAFIERLDLGPALVVGHSMGSTNAIRFAIDFPEQVRGLALVGSFASYRHNSVLTEFWATEVRHLVDPIDPDFVREFQLGTLAGAVPDAFLETIIEESLKVPARVWRASFEGLLEDDFVDDLERLRVPSLLFWGDRDGFASRSDQQTLMAMIADSRLLTYPGVGHGLHWERPERFASDLTAFASHLIAGTHRVPGSCSSPATRTVNGA